MEHTAKVTHVKPIPPPIPGERKHRRIRLISETSGPTQAAFIKDFKSITLGMSAGMGAGKTAGVVRKAVALAYQNPGAPKTHLFGVVAEPTLGMVQTTLIPAFEQFLAEQEIPHVLIGRSYGFDLTLPECCFTIMLVSAEKPNRLKGPSIVFFILDEAAQCKADAWRHGASRVRDARGKVLQRCAVGTPEGLGWFHERFATGAYSDTRLLIAPTAENAANLPPWYMKELQQNYDPAAFKAYALGQFVSMQAGAVFGDLFSRAAHTLDCPFDPYLPLVWGMDFNVDPMCAVLFQQQPDGTEVAVDEFIIANTHTEEFIRAMLAKYPLTRFPNQTIHPDATGTRRQTSAGSRTDVKLLRAAGYIVEYKRVENERDPINEVRRLLRAADGKIGLKVHRACSRTITMFESWAYKEGSVKTREEEYRGTTLAHVPHVADAVKYFAHSAHPITRPSLRVLPRR